MKKTWSVLVISCIITLQLQAQSQADSAFYDKPQSQWLQKKTGKWAVTMTLQPAIDEKLVVIKDMEAERTMVTAFCLHELMQPQKGAAMPLFKRLADLVWNFSDARWDYMSIDSRITGGIMFFTNMPDVKDSIVSYMLNTVHPGFGPQQKNRGKNMRVKNVVITIDENHDIVKQYWKLTDGAEWLAVMYDYKRMK